MPPEFKGQYLRKIDSDKLDAHRERNFPSFPPSIYKHEKEAEITPTNVHGLYQELVPHHVNPKYRDRLRESLERREMLLRRKNLDIPEFYVGSIVAATIADPHAPGKANRFVGICIERRNLGLWTSFTLRNVIDKIAVEIEYELYNPTLQKLECLKLEKRLDHNMFYLRDAPQEYSRVPLDMVAIPHVKYAPVPVNKEKVKLLPPPWVCTWYLHGYRGIDEDSMFSHLTPKQLAAVEEKVNSVDRYDLMKQYRMQVDDLEKQDVMRDVYLKHQDLIKYQDDKRKAEIERYRATRDTAKA